MHISLIYVRHASYIRAVVRRTGCACAVLNAGVDALLYMRDMSHIKPCLTNRLNIAYIHPSP